MSLKYRLFFWRTVLALIPVFAVGTLIQLWQIAGNLDIQILHSRWIFVFGAISLLAVSALLLVVVLSTHGQTSLLNWMEAAGHQYAFWRVLAGAGFVVLPFILSGAILDPYLGNYYFPVLFPRLLLFWLLSLIGMFCVRIIKKELSWLGALAVTAMVLAIPYRMAAVVLQVNNYPFALGWSDVSRIYGASLFFSQHLYGVHLPLSLLHPTWHLLLAPLYFFGNLPVWVFRLWQAFLEVFLTAALGSAIVKRFQLRSAAQAWMAAGWAFLFLMQGPILIHLSACALIVVSGVNTAKFWRTTLVVLAASIWAGWSRINWFPAPGLIAATIYLLEVPLSTPKRWLAYLWKPAFWFVFGTAIAIASNLFYVSWSGNGSGGNFTSSLSSAMLWYRLFPNSTYGNGVLLDLLLASLPILLALYFAFFRGRGALHPIRVIGIAGILAALGLGGLVVSAKIGGGDGLHNLDIFLIMLMLVGGYFFFGRSRPENANSLPVISEQPRLRLVVLLLALVIPTWSALNYGNALFTWNRPQSQRALSILKDQVEGVSARGGQVLFISQRQLLALKMVNVPLIPDYEQDFLMEMVMSNNRSYLDRFQTDLRNQRFALIVANEQNVHYYGKAGDFGEENDLWVREVAIPLLCYYRPFIEPGNFGVALYSPRETACK